MYLCLLNCSLTLGKSNCFESFDTLFHFFWSKIVRRHELAGKLKNECPAKFVENFVYGILCNSKMPSVGLRWSG